VIDTPRIEKTAPQPIAVIHLTVPRSGIREVMGPGLGELRAAVVAQGIAADGPWFTHHLRMHPDTFDFEIGVPVTAPVVPTGRVKGGEWPAMTVARTVFHGTYEGLGPAWGELDAWVAASGHTPAPDLWERYVAGPESSRDPTDWRTELNRPLAG
jgi:effector-binding domain-containing protein